MSVSGTANRITSTGGINPVIDIAATYVGQTSITTLGNITVGAWQSSTPVAVLYGGTGSTTAAGARTNLGSTTVGGNLFTLTNPGAITFLRINADNSVSTLDAATFRAAIGAGTGSGTVTSVASADPNATVATQTTTPVITIVSAPKWQTARTLSITGDLAYTSPSFDGSGNATATGTLATVNSNVGSFTNASITVNAKGLITAASSGSTPEAPLTFSTGLTRSTNTITANISSNYWEWN